MGSREWRISPFVSRAMFDTQNRLISELLRGTLRRLRCTCHRHEPMEKPRRRRVGWLGELWTWEHRAFGTLGIARHSVCIYIYAHINEGRTSKTFLGGDIEVSCNTMQNGIGPSARFRVRDSDIASVRNGSVDAGGTCKPAMLATSRQQFISKFHDMENGKRSRNKNFANIDKADKTIASMVCTPGRSERASIAVGGLVCSRSVWLLVNVLYRGGGRGPSRGGFK